MALRTVCSLGTHCFPLLPFFLSVYPFPSPSPSLPSSQSPSFAASLHCITSRLFASLRVALPPPPALLLPTQPNRSKSSRSTLGARSCRRWKTRSHCSLETGQTGAGGGSCSTPILSSILAWSANRNHSRFFSSTSRGGPYAACLTGLGCLRSKWCRHTHARSCSA